MIVTNSDQGRTPHHKWTRNSSPTSRAGLFVALAAVIGSTMVSVAQVGWTPWSAVAMVCALGAVAALLVLVTRTRR